MPQVKRMALVPFQANQMYQLVNDVLNYPSFVPKCTEAEIVSATESEIVATLKMDAGPLARSFTTRNSLRPGQRVSMTLENGPFKQLEGNWLFTPLGEDGCKVELELEFEFSNKIIGLTFNKLLRQSTEEMFAAFLRRAEELYGE